MQKGNTGFPSPALLHGGSALSHPAGGLQAWFSTPAPLLPSLGYELDATSERLSNNEKVVENVNFFFF